MTLFGDKAIADVISRDEAIVEQGGPLIHADRCPYKNGELGDRYTQGAHHEGEGRDQVDATTSQRPPQPARSHLNLLGKNEADSLSHPSEGTSPDNTLILDFQAPELWGEGGNSAV